MLRRTLAAVERRPAAALVVSIAALAVSLTGVAVATIPAKDGDVHACYSKRTGEIELINSQADQFRCARNWRGFTFDTTPTKLVSPNGRFSVEATNTGVSMTAPDGQVHLGADGLAIAGVDKIAINGDREVKIRTPSSTVSLSAAGIDIDGSLGVRVNGVTQSGD